MREGKKPRQNSEQFISSAYMALTEGQTDRQLYNDKTQDQEAYSPRCKNHFRNVALVLPFTPSLSAKAGKHSQTH